MLSAGLACRGENLLHHQCWAWGADVRYPEGNLLLRYGFERAALGEARRYVLKRADRLIVLWPFGLAFSNPSRAECLAIFVGRFSFEPRCITPSSAATAWSSDCLEELASDEVAVAAELDVTLGAVRWIEAYECWVSRVAGRAYRDRTLLTWDRAALCGGELRRGWSNLARDLGAAVLQPREYSKRALPPSARSAAMRAYRQ
jgi:hypothetical protein